MGINQLNISEKQNEIADKQAFSAKQQLYLTQAQINSSQNYMLNSLYEEIANEAKALKGKLSDALINKIAFTSRGLRPYYSMEGDSLSKIALSIERGQLLLYLLNTPLDTATYNKIYTRISFSMSDLSNIVFPRKTYLKNVDLRKSNLQNVELIGANLSGANLEGSDLSKSKFVFANLSDANCTGATLMRTNLALTRLTNVILCNSDLSNANLEHAYLDGSIIIASDTIYYKKLAKWIRVRNKAIPYKKIAYVFDQDFYMLLNSNSILKYASP